MTGHGLDRRTIMQFSEFHRQLRRWYGKFGRKELPWRNTRDPYAIYLSEVMLQQTQVATVRERFYAPFMKKFPTLKALADAPQQQVLSAWQGLGYYSRAVNLHKAAKACGGALPDSVEGLMALPGIGRNTAHAVAAFAFGKPCAVMEANVKRVICRLFALEKPGTEELWEKAQALLDKDNVFDFNQAMMDVGAMVCTRRAPRCGECPAVDICAGKAEPERYPAKVQKKKTPVRVKDIWVLCNARGEVYFTPRESKFLGGLHQFVEMEEGGVPEHISGAVLLGGVKQVYSHFTLEAKVWLADVAEGRGEGWHKLGVARGLPMSMAEVKVLALLDNYIQGLEKAQKRAAG